MSRKVADLSEKELEEAKHMFMELHSYNEISAKFNVPRTSLSYHANKKGSWKDEREMMKAELFAQFSSNKKMHFTRMAESSIKIISRALEEMASREIPPTVREAKDATVILESLDKITRLDDGNPTEIVAEKPTELKDIRARLRLDPFYEEIEDVKVIEKGSDNSREINTVAEYVSSESDPSG